MASVLSMKQLYTNYHAFANCTSKISINKKDIKKIVDIEILSLEIENTVTMKASYANITFSIGWITKEIEELLQIGAVITIEGGYATVQKTIFTGFLHTISYQENYEKTVEVSLIAMDVLAALMLGNQYLSKAQQKISTILKSISNNVTYKKYITKMQFPMISKSNDAIIPIYLKSDFEIVEQIVTNFQYEIFVANQTVYMGSMQAYSFGSFTLEDNFGIYQKEVEMSVGTLPSQVTIVGYDSHVKKITNTKKLSYQKWPGSKSMDTLVKNKKEQLVYSQIQDTSALNTLLLNHAKRIVSQYGFVRLLLIFIPDITCGSTITFMLGSQKLTCYVRLVHHYLVEDNKTMIEGCLL